MSEDKEPKSKTRLKGRGASLLDNLQVASNKGSLTKPDKAPEGPSSLAQNMRSALSRVKQEAAPIHRADKTMDLPERGCLGMVIDATASRERSWAEAKKIQRQLFTQVSAGDHMVLRLVVMRGGGYRDYGWHTDGEKLGQLIGGMSISGGDTRIVDSLNAFVRKPDGYKPAAVILIGDCCEDNFQRVLETARQLGQAGIRVYAFHETSRTRVKESLAAETLFKQIAAITGGAFAKFGDDMPLADLCQAVASFCRGGDDALRLLERQGNAAARQLTGNKLMIGGPKPE